MSLLRWTSVEVTPTGDGGILAEVRVRTWHPRFWLDTWRGLARQAECHPLAPRFVFELARTTAEVVLERFEDLHFAGFVKPSARSDEGEVSS